MPQLAATTARPVEQRLTATRTLDDTVGSSNVAAVQEPEEGEEEGVGIEALMLSLLQDSDYELRALGCRGLARAAMRGAEKKIVDAGGARALMLQVKESAEHVLGTSVVEGSAHQLGSNDILQPISSNTSDSQLTLLRDALNAVLNLSGARCAQTLIARHGLSILVHLWYHTQHISDASSSVDMAMIAKMVGGVLVNLACHPANRTLMYRAELQMKTAACYGQPIRGAPGGVYDSQPRARGGLYPTPAADKDMEELSRGIASIAVEGRDSPAEPNPEGESNTAPRSTKERYLLWLHETMRESSVEKAKERAEQEEREKADREQGGQNGGALARAAFLLMDTSEDGD